jgi:hypothetical protein
MTPGSQLCSKKADSLDLLSIHIVHGEDRLSVSRHQHEAPERQLSPSGGLAHLLRPILSS